VEFFLLMDYSKYNLKDECKMKEEKIIIEAAKKYLNGHHPEWKLFRGKKAYTAQEVIEALEKDKNFREWFVKNVLSLSTELFIRGKP
jgi:hypothetical protein